MGSGKKRREKNGEDRKMRRLNRGDRKRAEGEAPPAVVQEPSLAAVPAAAAPEKVGSDDLGKIQIAQELSKVAIRPGVVTVRDVAEPPDDFDAVLAQHKAIVEDAPAFEAKLDRWLAFMQKYDAAGKAGDVDSQAKVRDQYNAGSEWIRKGMFENTSIINRRIVWTKYVQYLLGSRFDSTHEITQYMRGLVKQGYLAVGERGPIRFWVERDREGDGYWVYLRFPEIAQIDSGSESEKKITAAFKAMQKAAGVESRKRWQKLLPGFLDKWKGGIEPDRFAAGDTSAHCLLRVPGYTTKKPDGGEFFHEGGWLVMQNKECEVMKFGKPTGDKQVRAYVVAFINDGKDERSVGWFEVKMRECEILKPPVFILPSYARLKYWGCPGMDGPIGQARRFIAIAVQRAYRTWDVKGAGAYGEDDSQLGNGNGDESKAG